MKDFPKKLKAVVIGSGPSGYTAAIRIAQLGGSVAIVEKDLTGGTCVNIGCIPTKFLASAAKALKKLKKIDRFGITVKDTSFDVKEIKKQLDRTVMKSRKGVEALLRSNNVTIVSGRASIEEKNKVTVYENGEKKTTLEAENIIIATGALPVKPESISSQDKVITSEDVFKFESIPERLLIIGGGYIGLEFAFIFNSLGSKVTVVEKLPRILSTEEEDISNEIKRLMTKSSMEVKENRSFEGEDLSSFDKVILAIGRRPNFNTEELEKLGVKLGKAGIETDIFLKTNVKGIYATGDVNGKSLLAHVGIKEGIVAAENIMGVKSRMDYDSVPSVVFTIPEIASVGKKEGKVGKFPFMANGKANTMNEVDGFVKVYVDRGKLVGGSIIGPDASSLINIIQTLLG